MESYQSIAMVVGFIGIFLGIFTMMAYGILGVWVTFMSILGMVIPLASPKHSKGVGTTLIILGILGNLLLIIPGIMALRYKPEPKQYIKYQ